MNPLPFKAGAAPIQKTPYYALPGPLDEGAGLSLGLKQFWVWQDFVIRLGPGHFQIVTQKGAPQLYLQPDPQLALRDFHFEMHRRFLEEQLPIVQWLGQPTIREDRL